MNFVRYNDGTMLIAGTRYKHTDADVNSYLVLF
jgi:hypothetical protein